MKFPCRAILLTALGFLYSLPSTFALSLQPTPEHDSSTVHVSDQQDQANPKEAKAQQQGSATETGEEADEPVTPVPENAKNNPNTAINLAWEMLTTAISSAKTQTRVDGLNAISTLPSTSRTRLLISKAIADPERDVRVAAVIAMGNLRDRSFIPQLRQLLDDRAPEVSFASAVALWKMNDHTGENTLASILVGEQKASSGLLSSGLHQANKDLHNPSTLAIIGAEQGAYAMLGPFGIGVDAYRLLRRGNSGNSARVLAANLLSSTPTPQIQKEFIAALHDKDYFVRGASARALGSFHGKEVTDALLEVFGDQKTAVRFLAAAAYIRASNPNGSSQKQSSTNRIRKTPVKSH